MIEITHSFDPSKFMWLWAKYVTGFNETQHCTNSIRGRYSRKLWKGNPELPSTPTLVMDEQPVGTYRAIYICGVSKRGYSSGKNYPHSVHAAILPTAGTEDRWAFEGWTLTIRNGRPATNPRANECQPLRSRVRASCPRTSQTGSPCRPATTAVFQADPRQGHSSGTRSPR